MRPASRHELVVLGVQLLLVNFSIGRKLTKWNVDAIGTNSSRSHGCLHNIGVSILIIVVVVIMMMISIPDVLMLVHLLEISIGEILVRIMVGLTLIMMI